MRGNALALVALEPLPRTDWLSHVEALLRSTGTSIKQRRNGLVAWWDLRRSQSNTYADGVFISRLWLGPGRSALSVSGQRVYFRADGVEIDDRPQHLIVSGDPPQSPKASEQLSVQWGVVTTLIAGLGKFSVKPVALRAVDYDLATAQEIRIGSNLRSATTTLNAMYREVGFDRVPGNLTVSVCPLSGVSAVVVEEFAKRLERCAVERHTQIRVRRSNLIEIEGHLKSLQISGRAVQQGHCVLFILPSQNVMPQSETLMLFEALESARVPFRRAYSDDPLNYSIPDQLPQLVIAAGGRPYRTLTQAGGCSIWTVGVDLSHRPERSSSVLALTLVDPDGSLVGAWATNQPRDETARKGPLVNLLSRCESRLRSLDANPHVVVLRDGRLFENEDSSVYEKVFRSDFSLFEYRKRGNPQIVQYDGTESAILEPVAAIVPNLMTIFMTTAIPRDERTLPSVAKVTWRPDWNRLNLRPDQIASLLVASAAAPGLGLHAHHLPAAIYWADGIAGAGNEDLRFRGLPVERLESADQGE